MQIQNGSWAPGCSPLWRVAGPLEARAVNSLIRDGNNNYSCPAPR